MVRAFIQPQDLAISRVLRRDVVIAAITAAFCALEAVVAEPDGKHLDLTGWLLLGGALLPLVWRRRRPMAVLGAHFAVVVPYHALDYSHVVPLAATGLALYSAAVRGPLRRTLLMVAGVKGAVAVVWLAADGGTGVEMLRVSGWLLAAIVLGEAVRLHGQYIAAIRERAERAERTREEEAARRVAEERLRIARDLHDLLAHSITLIGVRTSVASHVLIADPGRLDRAVLAEALESIAETCRDARAELRTTLQVLRGDDRAGRDDGNGHSPLPDLSGIPDLIRSAEEAGAKVALDLDVGERSPLPPVVSAATYRIVQESLTNAVRHGGPEVSVEVAIRRTGPALRIDINDDGTGAVPVPALAPGSAPEPAPEPGFGITGMRERARSIGGTLVAGPRRGARGFAVAAELPVAEREREREGASELS